MKMISCSPVPPQKYRLILIRNFSKGLFLSLTGDIIDAEVVRLAASHQQK